MPDPNAVPRTPDPDDTPGLRLRAEDRLGLLGPLSIVPYRSMGMPGLFHVLGRVIEAKGEAGDLGGSSVLANARTTLQRMASEEIPGVRLRAALGAATAEASTDHEGFFAFDLSPHPEATPGWHGVRIDWVDGIGAPAAATVTADVLVPPADAAFAVVSDVDDTIIETHSSDLIEQAKLLLTHTAATRPAIPGMAAFYRALAAGPERMATRADAAGTGNPLFYVSRTGWNLYDLFVEFMDTNGYPKGPLFLRDLRWFERPSAVVGRTNHKFERIDLLIRAYPELPFVLVGDSGMHDPELYADLIDRHPGRVRAVYIHNVTDEGREAELAHIQQRLHRAGVSFVLAQESTAFARHAADLGLVHPDAPAYVQRGAEQDRA